MAKEALKPGYVYLGAASFVMLVNYISVWTGHPPFLYCWGIPLFSYLYLTMGIYVVAFLIVYVIWQLLRGNSMKALGGIILMFTVFELPRLFDSIFRWGGSCGT